MHNKTLGNIFKGDKVVWMIFFFLCLVSIIEVYSASSQLTYAAGTNYWGPIMRHVGHLAFGCVVMYITSYIPCKWFKSGTKWVLIITILMLLYVAVSGKATNGAQRWMSLLGFSFQPSEIAKGVLILATAQILSATQTEKGASPQALGFIIVICIIPIALIAIDNLSTAALISLVILLMIFIGRVPARQIGKLLGVISIFAILAISAIFLLGKDMEKEAAAGGKQLTEQMAANKEQQASNRGVLRRLDTWKARFDRFFDDKELTPEEVDLRDKGSQPAYAKIAIASSNVMGKGPGNSEEREYLAQAYSDFIYAIIIEELGIGGAAGVAMLYVFLFFRAGIIARRCERNFPAFLVMGLALLFVVQALVNMYVAVGIIPVTGQPLPLISRGGTSTIINCVYFGMILSVSRTAKKKQPASDDTSGTQMAVATA